MNIFMIILLLLLRLLPFLVDFHGIVVLMKIKLADVVVSEKKCFSFGIVVFLLHWHCVGEMKMFMRIKVIMRLMKYKMITQIV